jgi:hypothetical protein
MRCILSFGISILSIVVGIAVVVRYYLSYGTGYGFCESAGWTLATLGAPVTFLYWALSKIGIGKSHISSFIWICFLYLLQYQLIAFLIYKEIINLSSKRGIISLLIIVAFILISAKIMWNVLGLNPPLH